MDQRTQRVIEQTVDDWWADLGIPVSPGYTLNLAALTTRLVRALDSQGEEQM